MFFHYFSCFFHDFFMIFHDFSWFFMIFKIFHDFLWFLMIFDHFWWFLMIFVDFWWFLMIFIGFGDIFWLRISGYWTENQWIHWFFRFVHDFGSSQNHEYWFDFNFQRRKSHLLFEIYRLRKVLSGYINTRAYSDTAEVIEITPQTRFFKRESMQSSNG